jgi:uncharacterized protein YdhG (YjbR/CyaY superfamily)
VSYSKTSKQTTDSEETFSAAEKAAMAEAARERKAASKRKGKDPRVEGEKDIQTKIAEMPESDRVIAERLHDLISAQVPELIPRTWYGMPAYAKDGKVLCFFQGAAKFDARYATFGFQDVAMLDEGSMWPTSFALTKLTNASEEELLKLIKRAVG